MSLISKVFRRSNLSTRMARRRASRLPLGGESLEGRLLLAATPTPWSTASRSVVPAAPKVALMSDTGSSAVDRITRVGTLAVTGAITGARVGYSIDGGRTWATSFTAKAGVNNVMVRQTSTAGANSPATRFSFTLDATAPAAPRVALQSDTGTSASDRITRVGGLAVSGTEAGAAVQYSLDAGKTWATTFSTVEGKNTLQARQIDVAGNASSATPFEFTRLSTAPIIETMTFNRTTRTATVVFNRPVTGVTVGDFSISGATGGFAFDFQATNPQLAPHVGAVSVSGSGRTWNLTLAKVPLQQSGSYAITLVAANSGIVDDAGNALMADKWTFLTT
jgi:hypothetical protein